MTGRRRLLAMVSVVAAAVLASACSGGGESSAPIALGGIDVDVPAEVVAGDPLVVRIADPLPATTYDIALDDGHAPDRIVLTTAGEPGPTLSVAFDTDGHPRIGRALVRVRAGRALTVEQTTILPGSAVDPVDVFVGPRTLPAGSDQEAMLVAVPTDAAGNPVSAGTDVSVISTNPDGSTGVATVSTNGLLAAQTYGPRTVAGTTSLGLTVDGPSGPSAPERSYLTVAGPIRDITIETPSDPLPLADGRTLATVRTEPIADLFGNPLPDGTLVVLEVDGPDGHRILTSLTIDTVAEFVIEAPSTPGTATMTARVGTTAGTSLVVQFEPAVDQIPAQIVRTDDATMLQIGRVRSANGAYVPDGTIAHIVAGATVIDAPLELGAASVELPDDTREAVIDVLGQTVRVAAEAGER